MSNVIPFKKVVKRTQNRKCSFCGVPEKEAKKFIASESSNHCICGDCIVHAKNRLKEEETASV